MIRELQLFLTIKNKGLKKNKVLPKLLSILKLGLNSYNSVNKGVLISNIIYLKLNYGQYLLGIVYNFLKNIYIYILPNIYY